MANTKNAEKRHRQSLQKRARNRARLSRLRTQVKKVRQAVASGDLAVAKELLPRTLSMLAKTGSKGVLHKRAADRRKSRLTRLVAGSPVPVSADAAE